MWLAALNAAWLQAVPALKPLYSFSNNTLSLFGDAKKMAEQINMAMG